MICRLCLKGLSAANAVHLFENQSETSLVKLIAKFLQLEVRPEDSVSTSVCTGCCEHLEDFNGFWQLVEQKQSTLNKQFLNVDCGRGFRWAATEPDGDGEGEPAVDEKPLDMQNLGLLDEQQAEGFEAFELLDQEQALAEESSDDYQPEGEQVDRLTASSEDEMPLVKLQDKLKPKRKKTRAAQKQRKQKRIPSLQQELSALSEESPRAKRQSQPTAKQASELQAAIERKPRGCTRAQLTKRYEEVIANYMPASCDLCEFSTKYLSDLKTHFLAEHQQEAYLKCCNKAFSRASKLMEHIRKHVNPKLFTCPVCNKALSSQDYLQTHIETVHNKALHNGEGGEDKEVGKYACDKCSKVFGSERRLANHLMKHENDQLEHNCEFCGKSFATVHRLRRHIQFIHEDLHPHVCDICGKKFKFKPSFDRHLLEHQGVISPAQQCTVCGVWLKNEHSLRLHRFTHDSTDTECKHCGKTCSSRTALRAHVKYAHKLQTNLQCTYCDKNFKQQRNLEEHMAIHTGLQLYNCPHCPKECRSRSNMYVHIKQRHADEWLKAKMARSHNPQYKPPS